MIANKCQGDDVCPKQWLDSPNGKSYGDKLKSTSITWAEMEDNTDPMSQPAVPYKWPNSGNGIYPGHELYDGKLIKPVAGSYVTEFVSNVESGSAQVSATFGLVLVSLTAAFVMEMA